MRAAAERYVRKTSAPGKLAAALLLAGAAAAAPGFASLAPPAIAVIAAALVIPGGLKRVALGAAAVATFAAAAVALKLIGELSAPEAAVAVFAPSALLAAKVFTLAALSALLGAVARADELARALYAPFKPLRRAHVDVAPTALTAAFTLRFLPAFARAFGRARDAALLRGARRAGAAARLRLAPKLLAAAYRETERTATAVADALALRGCRRARDYLDARRAKRPFGWPTVVAATATAVASFTLAML